MTQQALTIDSPAGMTPAEVVIDVFGGIRSTARQLKIEPSTVMRWGNRSGGRIPDEHKAPLLAAAAKLGKRLTLEELVWGRSGITRRVVSFGGSLKAQAGRPEPALSPLGAMARALTRCTV